MANPVDKRKLKVRDKVREDTGELHDSYARMQRQGDEVQRVFDLSLLEALLAKEITANQRASVEKAKKWLEGNPSKHLHPSWSAKYAYWLRGINAFERMKASGKEMKPYVPKKPRPRGQSWEKAPRPAWMSDSTLLPKKPPGRA